MAPPGDTKGSRSIELGFDGEPPDFPLPASREPADEIRVQLVLEFMPPREAEEWLREVFRSLRPAGTVILATPDLRALCQSTLDGDQATLDRHRAHGFSAATHGDMLNNLLYARGHRHLYDDPSLRRALETAGFVDVKRVSAPDGHVHWIDEAGPIGAVLWLRASKPPLTVTGRA